MAITAHFTANFDDFQRAVTEADVTLKKFEGDSEKVERTLQRMADSFSGVKIAQEATLMAEAIERAGGVAVLTASELEKAGAKANEAAEKLKLMGLAVPESIQKVGAAAKAAEAPTSLLTSSIGKLAGILTIGAVANWTANLLAAAGRLQDLHERTGIEYDALQEFSVIAEQSGSSIDAVAQAVFQMGRRLAGGDQNAASAAKELGLSLQDLQAMRPEDAFRTLGTAIADVSDPMKQAELGSKLFGRSVAELIPVFKQLGDEQKPLVTLTASQITLMDDLGDAYVRVKASIAPMIVQWADQVFGITELIDVIDTLRGSLNELPKATGEATARMNEFWRSVQNVAPPIRDLNTDAKALAAAEADLDKEHQKQVAAFDKMDAAMAELNASGTGWKGTLNSINGDIAGAATYYLQAGVAQNSLATAYGLSAVEVRSLATALAEEKKASEAAEAEKKKYTAALVELNSTGVGWQGTLSAMNEAIVQQVKGYLEAGASQAAIVEVYKLTEAQVKAVAKALADEQAMWKLEQQIMAETEKLWNDYNETVVRMTGTTLDVQIAKLNSWYTEQVTKIRALEAQGADTMKMWTALGARYQQEMDILTGKTVALVEETGRQSQRGLEQTAVAAEAAYAKALTHVGEWSDRTIQRYRDAADAARMAANNFSGDFEEAGEKAARGIDKTTEALYRTTRAAEEAVMTIAAVSNEMSPALATIMGGTTGLGRGYTLGEAAHIAGGGILGAPIGGIRSFDKGVTNFAGGLAKVHEDELLVNLPPGTDVIPRGGLGAGGATVINNTFHIVDTESNIARRVSDHLTRSVLQGRKLAAR